MIKYIIFVLFVGASAHDKQAIRSQLKFRFNDNIEINADELPQEQRITNPNVKVWRLVVSREQLKNCKANLDNITKAKLDTWKDKNLDNPNHFEVFAGDDWRAILTAAGLEPVPEEPEP